MIKLEKGEKPNYLSEDKVKELTKRFQTNPKDRVWKNKEIIKKLLESSKNKCAYCEIELQEKDSYGEIEHFKCKTLYPDHVVDWDNLLPSCKRCNTNKGSLDVNITSIINPYEEDPKLHLSLQNFRLYAKEGKNSKGDNTIKKLNLNEDERLTFARFKASNFINEQLEELVDNIDNIDFVRNGMSKVLRLCQRNKAFSAFLSSTLIYNPSSVTLKKLLQEKKLWDEEHIKMFNNIKEIALDPR